jgi:hypothetical protein
MEYTKDNLPEYTPMFIHVESYDVGEHFAVTPAAGCNYWAVTHKKSGRKFPLRNFYHYAENAANVVVELESMDVQWGDISPEDGKKNAELVPREMMDRVIAIFDRHEEKDEWQFSADD